VFFSVWNPIISLIQDVINWFERLWSVVQRALDTVKNVSGNIFKSAKSILGLQHGGIVTRPTFAMIGEAGAEAVIPLNRLGSIGVGGGQINVFIQGDVFTDSDIAQRWGRALAQEIKYNLKL